MNSIARPATRRVLVAMPALALVVIALACGLTRVAAQSAPTAGEPPVVVPAGETKAADSVPAATTELVDKARKVLKQYYDKRFEALKDRREFNSKTAWDDAAKTGGYDDYKAFSEAVAAQRKADPDHFPKLYDALEKEIRQAHLDKVKKDITGAAQ